MDIASTSDLQNLVRSRRLERAFTQQQVAAAAGVSRKWVSGFERGRTNAAELPLVLRLLAALDLRVEVEPSDVSASPSDHSSLGRGADGSEDEEPFDLDDHLARLADRRGAAR